MVTQNPQYDPDERYVRVMPAVVTALLGVWLAFSGWLLEQPVSARWNDYAVGAAVMIISVNGVWFSVARYLNVVLAVWLAASNFVMNVHGAAMWNHYVVALVVFLVSLVPTDRAAPITPRRPSAGFR